MVKFIKIRTTHNEEQLTNIISGLSDKNIALIYKIYSKFQYIEYIDSNKLASMIAIIHNNYINDLLDIYVNAGVDFIYEDLTKDALFSRVDTKRFTPDMISLVDLFVDVYLGVDDVLDKILEYGENSLTERDIFVLDGLK